MVRCGIIGAGSIGRQHVRELKAAGAGVSFDLGSHAFYRAWYAMGKPKPVSATAALYRKFITGDVDDFAAAFIRFEGEKSMITEASWVSTRSDVGKRTQVMGTEAGASFWADKNELTIVRRAGDAFEEERQALEPANYLTKFEHFVDCIVNGTECLCPGADGHTVQCVLDVILESSERGETVPIDTEIDPK